MRVEAFFIFFVNLAMSRCQRADFKVYKSLLPGPQFPIGGLPLFDEHINGHLILKHRFLLKFHLRCILMGAQCDIIGRWLKPRVEKIFIENKCESCTATQTKLVYAWVNKFIDENPELFRAALAKYAENMGIKLPPDERQRMIQQLGKDP
ncbi:unnamed protein product [Orchesella dallaii]|uniref:Odorant-binding protein A10 n=1 Tax=Orchesella dallaii TaxID=48710 RepID=A0ABP1RZ57_9HEXA